MNTPTATRVPRRCHAVAAVVLLAAAAAASDEPTRKPTPRPGTLADYARQVSLNAPRGDESTESLTITSENLAELARQGRLIRGVVATPRQVGRSTSRSGDRDYWRDRYFEQRRVVAALENRRARLAAEIDRLESGRLTAAVMARVDRAEIELRLLDDEIRTARLELARIVRDARRHGAEPGWFR